MKAQITFDWMWTEIFKYSIRYVMPGQNSKTSWLTTELYVGRWNYKWELENMVVSAKTLAFVTSPVWESAAELILVFYSFLSKDAFVRIVFLCSLYSFLSSPFSSQSPAQCVCPAARAGGWHSTHAMADPEVLHQRGLSTYTLLTSFCQRGQMKLNVKPFYISHTKLRFNTRAQTV